MMTVRRPASLCSRIRSARSVKTRPDGRLTLILPLNLDTRRIVLAYRAFRPGPITSQIGLKLTVYDRNGQLVRKVS